MTARDKAQWVFIAALWPGALVAIYDFIRREEWGWLAAVAVVSGLWWAGEWLAERFSWEARFDRATDRIVRQRRAEGKIP